MRRSGRDTAAIFQITRHGLSSDPLLSRSRPPPPSNTHRRLCKVTDLTRGLTPIDERECPGRRRATMIARSCICTYCIVRSLFILKNLDGTRQWVELFDNSEEWGGRGMHLPRFDQLERESSRISIASSFEGSLVGSGGKIGKLWYWRSLKRDIRRDISVDHRWNSVDKSDTCRIRIRFYYQDLINAESLNNRFLTISKYRDPIFVVYYFVAVSIRPISEPFE